MRKIRDVQHDSLLKIEASRSLFESLNSTKAIQKLIDGGEAENQYLECKSVINPALTHDLKSQLSQALSGFTNSGGGIIIWGVSTTKHQHSGLDILTQIEPIGSVKSFAQEIDSTIPRLIHPSTTELHPSTIIREKPNDTRGVVVTYIPPTSGDPAQANNGKFYLRIRDEFLEMPYETIKRMFSGTASPDLYPVFNKLLVKLNQDGLWEIPIALENRSSVAAKDVTVSIVIKNPSACETMNSKYFKDASDINPGKKILMADIDRVVHRGINIIAGRLSVKMIKIKRSKRVLNLVITIYATNMRARRREVTVELAKSGFSVKSTKDRYLY